MGGLLGACNSAQKRRTGTAGLLDYMTCLLTLDTLHTLPSGMQKVHLAMWMVAKLLLLGRPPVFLRAVNLPVLTGPSVHSVQVSGASRLAFLVSLCHAILPGAWRSHCYWVTLCFEPCAQHHWRPSFVRPAGPACRCLHGQECPEVVLRQPSVLPRHIVSPGSEVPDAVLKQPLRLPVRTGCMGLVDSFLRQC